jgi:hypothetical protein
MFATLVRLCVYKTRKLLNGISYNLIYGISAKLYRRIVLWIKTGSVHDDQRGFLQEFPEYLLTYLSERKIFLTYVLRKK